MADCTKVKFDVPIGTWGQTQVEVEYPWHRDLDSIILPLLESAHALQAERQRKHRSEGLPVHKSHSKKSHRSTIKTDRNDSAVLPMRADEDIKLYLKGFESARDLTTKRGETFQAVLEQYAQQTEKDVERLELFYKGKHVGRSISPDAGLKTVRSSRSMSSFSSSATSTQSRERRRRKENPPEAQTQAPEQDSVPVANDVDVEASLSSRTPWFIAPIAHDKNPLRVSHTRNSSRTTVGSTTSSDKAMRFLGINMNELQQQLAHIDSIIPMQHFSSGSITQIDLQPGPARMAHQQDSSVSIISNKAYEILGATVEETLEHLDLQIPSDAGSAHDSMSPVEVRSRRSSQGCATSIASSDKARRMLGVDRPDSDLAPGGRKLSVHADHIHKTRSYPAGAPTDYPTSTTSFALPDAVNRKPRDVRHDSAIAYRRRGDLVGAAFEDVIARKRPHMDNERNSGIVPLVEGDEHEFAEVKLTTTCSGPSGRAGSPDESMEPDHAIQYKIRGTVAKRSPKMSGIIESCNMRRSWSA